MQTGTSYNVPGRADAAARDESMCGSGKSPILMLQSASKPIRPSRSQRKRLFGGSPEGSLGFTPLPQRRRRPYRAT
eukprot:scaffold173_cov221-Pinguiococcus_pyrenoidosus.AAC.3